MAGPTVAKHFPEPQRLQALADPAQGQRAEHEQQVDGGVDSGFMVYDAGAYDKLDSNINVEPIPVSALGTLLEYVRNQSKDHAVLALKFVPQSLLPSTIKGATVAVQNFRKMQAAGKNVSQAQCLDQAGEEAKILLTQELHNASPDQLEWAAWGAKLVAEQMIRLGR